MKHNKVTINTFEDDQCRMDIDKRVVDFNLEAVKLAINEMVGADDDDDDNEWEDYSCICVELEYNHEKFTKTSCVYGDIEEAFNDFVASIELSESLVDAFDRVVVNHSHNNVVIGNYPNHVHFVIMMSERAPGTVFINDITRRYNGPYTKHTSVNDVVPYLTDVSMKI
ncbi:hypothetical protein phiAS5_ORF0065 [Aeromonas phage phiAS5]|uniref:Uncharacterized protein n=1 Tax=Aeromonas phage phiAS5 TaxID=879630 RepID=E1A2G2_9CAUD|nr:hypothetical protein phiAS5_ORF0065 [Aeromonas phage phiAS5]ADM79908.1 hypothetical protein phiAS5_ORF0065 [Aeromonas phage phiAS5]BES53322.1 hypothetical protein [Aeromonas phage phiWae14]